MKTIPIIQTTKMDFPAVAPMTLMVQMILTIQKTLMVLTAPMVNPTMNPKMTQTVYSYMHYTTSWTACRTSINPKPQNLRKSKSVNQILLMELTLGNSEIPCIL